MGKERCRSLESVNAGQRAASRQSKKNSRVPTDRPTDSCFVELIGWLREEGVSRMFRLVSESQSGVPVQQQQQQQPPRQQQHFRNQERWSSLASEIGWVVLISPRPTGRRRPRKFRGTRTNVRERHAAHVGSTIFSRWVGYGLFHLPRRLRAATSQMVGRRASAFKEVGHAPMTVQDGKKHPSNSHTSHVTSAETPSPKPPCPLDDDGRHKDPFLCVEEPGQDSACRYASSSSSSLSFCYRQE